MEKPIRIDAHDPGLSFVGGSIIITDRPKLIEMVAHLIIGQSLHVEMILSGVDTVPLLPSAHTINTVVKKLRKPPSDPLRYHRDGWVFQFISWIALRSASSSRVLTAPHMQPAQKGFDCLYLDFASDENFVLTVCEDKATEHTRDTVRDDVFPSFEVCERGDRDHELLSELTALLRHGGRSASEVLKVVESVQWAENKSYCATVTAPSVEATKPHEIYDKFDASISGEPIRRTGNVFPVDELRGWLDGFCEELISALNKLPLREVKTESSQLRSNTL